MYSKCTLFFQTRSVIRHAVGFVATDENKEKGISYIILLALTLFLSFLQHHVTSWSSLLTSLDAKADHISRAQSEAQSVVNGQLQSVLSATQLGLESVGQKWSEVDSKVGEISSLSQNEWCHFSRIKRI